MTDYANEDCIEKCKAAHVSLTREGLIDKLLLSGCCSEFDRQRLEEKMTNLGLIAELCGCECSGHFPYRWTADQHSGPGDFTPTVKPKGAG